MTTSPKTFFLPISGARAFEEVVEQLTFAIRSGVYGLNARLPNIDELSHVMQVSKPTIGQALKVLADAGLIRVQRGVGGGARVLSNQPPPKPLADISFGRHFSFVELIEARKPLEVQIAILASQRADDEGYAELEDSIVQMKAHLNKEQNVRIYHDHRFHYILGKMCRNRALALYQHQILERLFFEMSKYNFFSKEEKTDSVLKWHKATVVALKTKDENKIRHVVEQHLKPLEDFALRDAQKDKR